MFTATLHEQTVASHHWSAAQAKISIFLVKDTDAWGERAYYFIRVAAHAVPKFLRETKYRQAIDLSDYGEILFSAYGEHPSPGIEATMRERYGWEG